MAGIAAVVVLVLAGGVGVVLVLRPQENRTLRVTDGRYWSYRCTGLDCCPADGTPYVFTERDGKTTVTSTSTFTSREDRDGMLQSGMETGAEQSYAALDDHLAKLAQSSA